MPCASVQSKPIRLVEDSEYVQMAKIVCPTLRDSASGRGGNFTQPRTNFFGQLCIIKLQE